MRILVLLSMMKSSLILWLKTSLLFPAGNLVTPLPMKDRDPILSDQSAVHDRTITTLKRMKSNTDKLLASCISSMNKSLLAGFVVPMSEVQASTDVATRSCASDDMYNSGWFTGPDFLWQRELPVCVVPSSDDVLPEERRRCRVQYYAAQFWVRWRRHMMTIDQWPLTILQRRHKWCTRKPCIAVWDVVLIRDKSAARNSWPLYSSCDES